MTSESPADGVDSPDEFRAALEELLAAAARNDVDVEGGWECRDAESGRIWDVVVTDVERSDRDSE